MRDVQAGLAVAAGERVATRVGVRLAGPERTVRDAPFGDAVALEDAAGPPCSWP